MFHGTPHLRDYELKILPKNLRLGGNETVYPDDQSHGLGIVHQLYQVVLKQKRDVQRCVCCSPGHDTSSSYIIKLHHQVVMNQKQDVQRCLCSSPEEPGQ